MLFGSNESWLAAIFFIIWFFAGLPFGGSGIYQFVSKQFGKTSLVVSAIIISSVFVWILFENQDRSLTANLMMMGMPFSFIALLWSDGSMLFSLIGIALNYFAIFGIVNFIEKSLAKVNS